MRHVLGCYVGMVRRVLHDACPEVLCWYEGRRGLHEACPGVLCWYGEEGAA